MENSDNLEKFATIMNRAPKMNPKCNDGKDCKSVRTLEIQSEQSELYPSEKIDTGNSSTRTRLRTFNNTTPNGRQSRAIVSIQAGATVSLRLSENT